MDLWNEAPDNAAELVSRVISECVDAGIPLVLVEVDERTKTGFAVKFATGTVSVRVNPRLDNRVEFYRRPPVA